MTLPEYDTTPFAGVTGTVVVPSVIGAPPGVVETPHTTSSWLVAE
jgi:hypothetical protein